MHDCFGRGGLASLVQPILALGILLQLTCAGASAVRVSTAGTELKTIKRKGTCRSPRLPLVIMAARLRVLFVVFVSRIAGVSSASKVANINVG